MPGLGEFLNKVVCRFCCPPFGLIKSSVDSYSSLNPDSRQAEISVSVNEIDFLASQVTSKAKKNTHYREPEPNL
jgi:hypothetical protein